jgi:hypothetical protein
VNIHNAYDTGLFFRFSANKALSQKGDPSNGGEKTKKGKGSVNQRKCWDWQTPTMNYCGQHKTFTALKISTVAHKICSQQKSLAYRRHLYWQVMGIRYKKWVPKRGDFTFHWPMFCLSPRYKLPKACESCVFPLNYTSILQLLDQGIITSFKQ